MSKGNTLEKKAKFNWKDYTAAFGLILLVIISAVLSKTFLLPNNLINILKSNAPTGVMALGMTFAILTGGIDLAMASILAMSGVIVAMTINSLGIFLSVALALAFGVINGLAVGVVVTKFRVPPFIATLASQNIWRGLAYVVTGAAAKPITNLKFNNFGTDKLPMSITLIILALCAVYVVFAFLRSEQKGKKLFSTVLLLLIIAFAVWLTITGKGMSYLICVFVVAFFVCWYILEHSVYGRQVYALGGNPEAARFSGIRVDRNIILVYMISSLLAALGGVLAAARLGSGVPQLNVGGETDAIAAVVLGGTSMSGGSGKITGTILGILLIGVLNNLLTLLGVSSDLQMVFKGVIVLIAVILDTTNHK
ncbi:MAG: ribose ABC transporter permease [Oscillibacter sp.]|nr:ribose ABC transporter permease [Oscillibacter sp.]